MTTNATAGGARITAGRAPRTYLLELIVNEPDPTAVLARIRQMADYWEQNLPEVIRTPAVVSALRAAMESAPAVVSPPTDRADLRERIARAIYSSDWPNGTWERRSDEEHDTYLQNADAVLAVLPEPTDRAAEFELRGTAEIRAAALAEAADHFDRMGRTVLAASQVRDALRRLAVEAHDTGTQQQQPVATRAYPDCERCGDTGVDPEQDGAPCPDCQGPVTEVRPARGDQFEAWLRMRRDQHGWQGSNDRRLYDAFDNALDRYRLHADTGTPLDQHACEGPHCDCLRADEPAPVAQQPDGTSAAGCAHRGPHPGFTCAEVDQTRPFWEGRWDETPAEQQAAEADGEETPHTVCVCGHTRGEHLRVSGRLLCDACDGLSPDACKEFEAL